MATIWERTVGNTRYEVRRAGRSLRLYSDGVFHSHYNPQHVLTGGVWDLFLVAALLRPPEAVKRVLVLGVGAGTALLLLKRFLPQASLVGVDLDAVHLEVAREHFGVDARIAELHHADARDWIAQDQGPGYDLIIEDLFGHTGGQPGRAVDMDSRWTRQLLERLQPDGTLCANFISPQELTASAPMARREIRRAFDSAFILRAPHDENAVGAFCRAHSDAAILRDHLRQHPELDTRKRACRLRYAIRRLW